MYYIHNNYIIDLSDLSIKRVSQDELEDMIMSNPYEFANADYGEDFEDVSDDDLDYYMSSPDYDVDVKIFDEVMSECPDVNINIKDVIHYCSDNDFKIKDRTYALVNHERWLGLDYNDNAPRVEFAIKEGGCKYIEDVRTNFIFRYEDFLIMQIGVQFDEDGDFYRLNLIYDLKSKQFVDIIVIDLPDNIVSDSCNIEPTEEFLYRKMVDDEFCKLIKLA